MFDISFAELLIIAVIGLLVIGPKRLPDAIRTLALWIGRLRRGVTRAYREIEKEVGMDEIRRQLHNEEIMRTLNSRISTESENKAKTTTESEQKPAASDTASAASGNDEGADKKEP